MITFNPNIKYFGKVAGASLSKIREEQESMVHSGSIKFAVKHGGDLCRRVIKYINDNQILHKFDFKDYHTVIDTKVCVLMPGQYPSIPGWHCDAVPRQDVHSQPDLLKLDEDQWHFLCTMSNIEDGSRTEFLSDICATPHYKQNVWESVSNYITSHGHALDKSQADNNEVVAFNQPTLHRATPATKREMRFFFRMSMYRKPPENKHRHQVQIYTTEHGGW